MAQALKIVLITALWYGGFAALLIFVVAPWLHTGVGYNLQDGVTLPIYQKKALTSAAIGYPLLCAVLIFGSAYRRRNAAQTVPVSR
ncbi:MAG: hypothetical protein H7145_13395 [Akkermansiaceae bacterium]|nr:hypothetical protein [Armatimonadota bacterium]